MDPSVLLAACGEDAIALERLCGALRSGLPSDLAEVEAALVAEDAPRLQRAAHRLQGILSAFSTVAAATASELEDHAARAELAQARSVFARLRPVTEELMQLVGRLSLDAVVRARKLDE